MLKVRALLVASLLCLSQAAAAEDNPLLGKWVEKLQYGSIITQFTDTTMTYSAVDLHGKAQRPPHTFPVSYRKREEENSYEVKFSEEDGRPVTGSLLFYVKDPDTIEMHIPGVSADLSTHTLKRMN